MCVGRSTTPYYAVRRGLKRRAAKIYSSQKEIHRNLCFVDGIGAGDVGVKLHAKHLAILMPLYVRVEAQPTVGASQRDRLLERAAFPKCHGQLQ